MIYVPCNHLQHASKHVLDLLLKGPQLVSIVTIHTKTVSKQSILTQRDEVQRFVGRMGSRQLRNLVHRIPDDAFNLLKSQ